MLVDRQQLDRGDPEVHRVGDGGVVGQPRKGAAQLGGHAGVAHGEPLDVDLVDDGVGVAVPGPGGGGGVGQSKAGSTTRLRGTCPAESSRLARSGSSASWPRTSGPNRTGPVVARA